MFSYLFALAVSGITAKSEASSEGKFSHPCVHQFRRFTKVNFSVSQRDIPCYRLHQVGKYPSVRTMAPFRKPELFRTFQIPQGMCTRHHIFYSRSKCSGFGESSFWNIYPLSPPLEDLQSLIVIYRPAQWELRSTECIYSLAMMKIGVLFHCSIIV